MGVSEALWSTTPTQRSGLARSGNALCQKNSICRGLSRYTHSNGRKPSDSRMLLSCLSDGPRHSTDPDVVSNYRCRVRQQADVSKHVADHNTACQQHNIENISTCKITQLVRLFITVNKDTHSFTFRTLLILLITFMEWRNKHETNIGVQHMSYLVGIVGGHKVCVSIEGHFCFVDVTITLYLCVKV